MNLLLNQVQGILTLFGQLENELNYLSENPDDLRRERLEFLTNKIDEKRNELKLRYPGEELKKLNPLFANKISTVQYKLQEIIGAKNETAENIKYLLKIHRNRKKMVQYEK